MAPFRQTTLLAHQKSPADLVKPTGRHPGGRPSEYKQEYCEMVIEAMRDKGVSLTAFAGMIGVARDTVYGWLGQHREFSDAVSRARSARVLFLELKMLSARKGAEAMTSMFALKNAQPDEWRDVRHTSTTHLHAIAQLSDAQLNAIAAGQALELSDQTIDGTSERLD